MRALFIIGAMECGTASLFEWLAHHPQIFPSRVKASGYASFSKGVRSFPKYETQSSETDVFTHRFGMNLQKYRVVMHDSTEYCNDKDEAEAPQHIHRQIRELGWRPRFIYVVRDPFERIESQFNQRYSLGQEKSNADLCDETYVGLSRYALQLQQYRRVFGKESLLVLSFDELRREPKKVLARCHQFLGLGPSLFNRWLPHSVPKTLVWQSQDQNYGIPDKQRRLTTRERQVIKGKLWTDMRVLRLEYGIDVTGWGFDIFQPPAVLPVGEKVLV